jgi:hypothetical protein
LTVFCAVAASIAAGYEFDDPLFNQVLLQDLLDANDYEASSLRVRRQSGAESASPPPKRGHDGPGCHGPPGGRGPEGWKDKSCCEDKLFNETFHEGMHKIKMECFEETRKASGTENSPPDAFHCGGMGRAKKEFACVMLCVAKKQNIIDDNDEIMEDEAKTFLKTEALAPEWAKEKSDDIVDKCAKEAIKMDEKPKSNEIDDDEKTPKCRKTALKFAHCIFRELSMECPAEKQKDSKMCNMMREKGFKRSPGGRGGSKEQTD